MSKSEKTITLPLLFKKRRPVDRSVAAQYVGTATELDYKPI